MENDKLMRDEVLKAPCRYLPSFFELLRKTTRGGTESALALTLRSALNICSINGDDTTTAKTQIYHIERFCALLIPRFSTSDFETETEKQQST